MRPTQASALWKWTLTMVLPEAARGVGDALLFDVPADDGVAAAVVRRWMAGRESPGGAAEPRRPRTPAGSRSGAGPAGRGAEHVEAVRLAPAAVDRGPPAGRVLTAIGGAGDECLYRPGACRARPGRGMTPAVAAGELKNAPRAAEKPPDARRRFVDTHGLW